MDNNGNFSAHLNQHSNHLFNPSHQIICCPNCGHTNFGELNWVQDFMHHLKPSIGEEVKRVFYQVVLPYLQHSVLPPISSSLPHQAEPSASRSWQLKFKGSVPDALLTWTRIEEEGGSLEVELRDEFGKVVEVDDPESPVKIKIDVLDGDFDVEDDEVDRTEEYDRNIVKPRETKGALLKGKSEMVLTRGVANLSHISFTDNSATRTNKKFRLGARVVKGLPSGVVVKAAVSEAFRVKERRLKRDRKYKIPSLKDDLWRLVNIRKDGPVHERALRAGISTVKDLLQRYHTYPEQVQHILDVSEATMKKIVENAEACKLPNEHYRYYNDASGDVLELDYAFNIVSVAFKDQINQLYKDLDDFHKEKADELRCSAYEIRSELERIYAPVKQTSDYELTHESFIQGQEQLPPPLLPPLSGDSVLGGNCESPDANCLVYNQMCMIAPTHVQSLDATTADQVKPVEHVNRCIPTLRVDSFQYYVEHLEASMTDPDYGPDIRELQESVSLQQERGHVCQVKQVSRDPVTRRKLVAACYGTKAAVLFMISVKQDQSAPNKKRKLQ